ncbi:MAG: nucleotidyltransferase substrate binding protein [Planctomycetaceae bacterium]|jgi:nucleotidyltransferase substrate binding protein (TIGR01987 family)|nr:nucleotidyltransferase substrate binding protein [Planctomycetaceae bacterium]
MNIDTTYFSRCIATLEKALELLQVSDTDDILYDMYRSACIKEFEIILEQSGKLLRKMLKPYFHSSAAVDKLVFKELFRNAVLHSIITSDECERWLQYRDNRNSTTHDYGVAFAEKTLILLPQFIIDARKLCESINEQSINEQKIE